MADCDVLMNMTKNLWHMLIQRIDDTDVLSLKHHRGVIAASHWDDRLRA